MRAYGARLSADLAADTVVFAWFRDVLDQKAELLTEILRSELLPISISDPPDLMARLRHSTFVGLPPIDASTFEELQSTGGLHLIEDPDLRSELTRYYSNYERMTTILDERFGSYRETVFASIPGDLEYVSRIDSLDVDPELLRDGLTQLLARPALLDEVNAELNYTGALLENINNSDAQAKSLLSTLAERYPERQ